jgi:hypothetical protein
MPWSRRGQDLAPWPTAVAGLAARPVLDVHAAVATFGCTPQVAAVLAGHRWHPVPTELARWPWRGFYVLPDRDRRSAHLHACSTVTSAGSISSPSPDAL